MDGIEVVGWNGMDLALPFWNFIVGEYTGVMGQPWKYPILQLSQVNFVLLFIHLFI